MLEKSIVHEQTLGSEEVLNLVSDKWTIQVMHAVRDGYCRFGEMRRAIPTITRRMLTLRLRDLERNGLLTRHVFNEVPPHVEYAFTPLGESLLIHLTALCQWSKTNLAEVERSRQEFDLKNEPLR